MARLFGKAKGYPEDKAIRVVLREVARRALALEDMLAEGLLWGGEAHTVYRKTVEHARVIGEMQWGEPPDSEAPADPSDVRSRGRNDP